MAGGLDLKYRPDTFDKVLGNENEIEVFKNNLEKEEGKQCFIISGPSGCGKTTLARIAAKHVGGTDLTITELNTAETRGIDTVRNIIEQCRYSMGGSKVFIIDEAHGLTADAKRAFLKPAEEPEDHVYLFFLTTDPTKLFKGDEGKALKTRLTPVKVSSVKPKPIYKHLRRVCKWEGLKISNDVLEYISNNCEGSPRRALVLLDNIKDLDNEDSQIEKLENTEYQEDPQVFKFCQTLFSSKRNWKTLSGQLKLLKETQDSETIRRMVMGYAQSILFKADNSFAVWALECFCECTYDRGFPGITLATYQCLQEPEED